MLIASIGIDNGYNCERARCPPNRKSELSLSSQSIVTNNSRLTELSAIFHSRGVDRGTRGIPDVAFSFGLRPITARLAPLRPVERKELLLFRSHGIRPRALAGSRSTCTFPHLPQVWGMERTYARCPVGARENERTGAESAVKGRAQI